jgi:hypothetical protein
VGVCAVLFEQEKLLLPLSNLLLFLEQVTLSEGEEIRIM